MIRVLLIGPLPPPIGGNTRHVLTLIDDLEKSPGFSVKSINTSRGLEPSSFLRNLATTIKTISALVFNLRDADVVSYHASDRGMFAFGPFVVVFGRLARIPTVLRVFGGSFGDFYGRQSRLKKVIIRKLILSSDAVLLQTRRAIQQLQAHATGRLVWFSTYIRPVATASSDTVTGRADNRETCSRFVFLGHLWRTKGIETILDAAERLPGESSVDIYGPLDEYTAEEIRERGMGRVRYCGLLTHAEVDAKLWDYDCLVLPTFHPGEGYPGVIAEAYAHRLPVITTKWLAIPEIVGSDCGILIEPNDTEAFVAALRSLFDDPALWQRLKTGARMRAKQFDHSVWSRRFEEVCEQLVQESTC